MLGLICLRYNRCFSARTTVVSYLLNLQRLEQRPIRTIIVIAAVLAFAYILAMTSSLGWNDQIMNGDAIQYYAYLRSLVFDRDVDFINDYRLLYGTSNASNIWLSSRTPTGLAVNLMSIGPALLWLPFFLIACGLVALAQVIGFSIPFDGVAMPFQLSAGIAGLTYGATGIYLCYKICKQLYPRHAALWATLVAWLATPTIYYNLVSPAYSHATAVFSVSVFIFVWLRTIENRKLTRYAMLGALGGLTMLVRWQDGVLLLLPTFELVHEIARKRISINHAMSRLIVVGAGAFVVFLPQMIAWQQMYGQLLLTPQGEDFMRWGAPQVTEVLFSTKHGLFSWTPAIIPAVIGLACLVRQHGLVGWSSVGLITTTIYINASVIDWWAGEAFGARRFISMTPLFALGLTALISGLDWRQWQARIRAVAIFLIVSNMLFLTQYQLSMHGYDELAPYPTTVKQILVDRFLLPIQLLSHWTRQ